MKHAILILAHKEFSLLCRIINYFAYNCDVFLHIDKKSSITSEEMDTLHSYPNVKMITRKFSVHWGGFSMLKCELYMLRQALEKSDASYFHLISGQDYPIRPLDDLLSFFNSCGKKNYIYFHHLPYVWWEGCTFHRFQYYYPYDWVQGRTEKGQKFINSFLKRQVKWNIKRSIPDQFAHLYGGSQWFSITRKAVVALLDYTNECPAFYRRMKYTYAPEETYVSTILVNLLPKEEIVCDDLRFVRWKYENGSFPANLSMEHFALFFLRKDLFVRKIATPNSDTLLAVIDEYLLKNVYIDKGATGVWKVKSFLPYTFNHSLGNAILNLYYMLDVETVLDAGCGAGLYVCFWRANGMAVAGCDGNPYTTELSSLLLSSTPCEVADLTDDLEVEDKEPFDMVICMDVLCDIPTVNLAKVIFNLVRLCGKYLLITLPKNKQSKNDNVEMEFLATKKLVMQKVNEFGFVLNIMGTNFLSMQVMSEMERDFLLFQKI